MTKSKFNSKFHLPIIRSMALVLGLTLILGAGLYFVGKANYPKPSIEGEKETSQSQENSSHKGENKPSKSEANLIIPSSPNGEENKPSDKDKPSDKEHSQSEATPSLELDSRAKMGLMPGVKEDAFANSQENAFLYIVNRNMTMEKPNDEANVLIYNPIENNYYFSVTMLYNGREILETKALKPGSYIETARLGLEFQKGSYDIKVQLNSFDLETKEPLNSYTTSSTLKVGK